MDSPNSPFACPTVSLAVRDHTSSRGTFSIACAMAFTVTSPSPSAAVLGACPWIALRITQTSNLRVPDFCAEIFRLRSRFVLMYSARQSCRAMARKPCPRSLARSSLSSANLAGCGSGTTSRGSCGNTVGTPSSPICSRRSWRTALRGARSVSMTGARRCSSGGEQVVQGVRADPAVAREEASGAGSVVLAGGCPAALKGLAARLANWASRDQGCPGVDEGTSRDSHRGDGPRHEVKGRLAVLRQNNLVLKPPL
jgi:hypothetical protein